MLEAPGTSHYVPVTGTSSAYCLSLWAELKKDVSLSLLRWAFPEIQFLPPFLPELAETLAGITAPWASVSSKACGRWLEQPAAAPLSDGCHPEAGRPLSVRPRDPAPGLLLDGLSAKNSFHIFKWLKKIKRIIFWDTWKLREIQISESINNIVWNTASLICVGVLCGCFGAPRVALC